MRAVVAIANGKGGVGKSTAAVSLGHAAALLGAKTLVVDLDGTTHTVTTLVDHEPVVVDGRIVNMSDLMLTEAPVPIAAVTCSSAWGFDVAPIDSRLTSRWLEQTPGVEYRLRSVLEDHGYDLVLLDVPPGLGLVSHNALAAADSVIIPVFPDASSLEALGEFYFGQDVTVAGVATRKPSTIDQIRKHFNPSLEVAGIIVTAMENTNNARHHVAELRQTLGGLVWEPLVSRYTAVRDAETLRVPVATLTAEQGGGVGSRRIASAYRELAARLLSYVGVSGEPATASSAQVS